MTGKNDRSCRPLLALGIAAAGAAAGAWALHRAMHPSEARLLDGGRRPGRPVDGSRYDLPDDVEEHLIGSSDGGTIRYLVRGTGRPLVLLHGVTLRADVWAPQFHDLADRFQVIAVDLRGHGASTPGDRGFGMDRLGDDIATLLETLDLRDAIVAGHSMGGMALGNFCGRHREVLAERVAGLVFVATAAERVMPARVADLIGGAWSGTGIRLPGPSFDDPRAVRAVFGQHPNPRAVRIVAEMGAGMDPVAILESVKGIFGHDAREALRATDTPSMVLVGSRDILTPAPLARALARALPDSDFVLLPGAGHQLMQERPDELDQLLRAFADRLFGAADDVSEAVAGEDGPIDPDQVEHHP